MADVDDDKEKEVICPRCKHSLWIDINATRESAFPCRFCGYETPDVDPHVEPETLRYPIS